MAATYKPPAETAEEMKERVRISWSSAASAYSEWVINKSLVRGMFEAYQAELVPGLEGRPGVRILDVASASGEPAATLAAALPQARLLSTDLAAPFLELGRARARRLGLTNVEFGTADAEDLGALGEAAFQAVTCSLGVMFMPRADAALAEFLRVLAPGGSLALTVWGPEERNPFFAITRQLATHYDPTVPPSFAALRFAEPGKLVELMRRVGLQDVQCREVTVDMSLPKDLFWEAVLNLPLPIKSAVAQAQEARPGDDVFEEARAMLQRLLAERGCWTPDGDMACSGSVWFITAKKAA